jgi:crossover junction endodeoxyribonuclease RuvC
VRILGIDPGTAITGFGVIDKVGDKLLFVDAGVIRTPKEDAMPARLVTLYDELTLLIAEFQPDQAGIELLFFARNVTTAITVGQARGVAVLAMEQAHLPVGEYTPLQIKQAVTSYGKADKAQVQQMVKTILGLRDIPRPDDAADGLAIAITHASQLIG